MFFWLEGENGDGGTLIAPSETFIQLFYSSRMPYILSNDIERTYRDLFAEDICIVHLPFLVLTVLVAPEVVILAPRENSLPQDQLDSGEK